jgi:hypothetical protein
MRLYNSPLHYSPMLDIASDFNLGHSGVQFTHSYAAVVTSNLNKIALYVATQQMHNSLGITANSCGELILANWSHYKYLEHLV